MPLRVARFEELDTTTLYALLRLRAEVFVVEQDCAYLDLDGRDTEPATLHLWYETPEGPLACLRVLQEPGGGARIGRVVTAAAHRGAGHAARLITRALELIGGCTPCVLEAQVQAAPLYEKFGFVPAGREYLEDGIAHVTMRREPLAAISSGNREASHRMEPSR